MRFSALVLTLTILAFICGCQSGSSEGGVFSQSIWDPFDLNRVFVADQEPIRIGVVTDGRSAWDVSAWWDLRSRTPWTDLRRELASHTRRPVQVEQLKLFQVAAHLDTGRVDFALLSDAQLADMKSLHDRYDVIARADALDRVGLIVADAKSNILSIEDIRGRRFAFGPRGDPVLHYGAAAQLDGAGVSLDEVQRELVPINALQYHINSTEAAKEIAYGTTEAGVISRTDYDRFPETGGRFLPLSFSKDQFRVIGETTPVDFGPFVASREANPELVRSVTEFLVGAARKTPGITRSLGVAAFTSVGQQSAVNVDPAHVMPAKHDHP